MPEARKLIYEEEIPPKKWWSGVVKKGQCFRIIDVMGKQVADVVIFNQHNLKEKHSLGASHTRQMRPGERYKAKDRLSVRDVLFSTAYRSMMTIVADTPVPGGIHEVGQGRMCNRAVYETMGFPDHDGCWENLSRALEKWGIAPEEIPDAFCPFMNTVHDVAAGEWLIKEPVSRPGDYLELRAEMDVIVGLSNCPEDAFTLCNGRVCTPLKIQIYEE